MQQQQACKQYVSGWQIELADAGCQWLSSMPCEKSVLPDPGMLRHVQLRFGDAYIALDARDELFQAAEAHLRPAHACVGLEAFLRACCADKLRTYLQAIGQANTLIVLLRVPRFADAGSHVSALCSTWEDVRTAVHVDLQLPVSGESADGC